MKSILGNEKDEFDPAGQMQRENIKEYIYTVFY